ncbi:DUF4058 family protein [Nodosilinea sp. LEGE 07298]|uniref:DUF4058 family protein n=1 Tax=Nodosilinea sp. LEGE 07298 TaxID=2777970 RepID=UPI00188086B3|nr:DUF4058 family protein [Nodosilinea sp. LEGE 07298]MBE9110437.1 DUF4058 family protein [Nodosilinea sp. LEGE 07298]
MASPFPGMDPYLEHPEIWPGVHLLLIAALAEALGPQLRPKYSVSVEVRMYETSGDQALLVGIPDVAIQRAKPQAEVVPTAVAVAPLPQPVQVRVPMPLTIRQGYLEVREVTTKEVVTAIELLSPINKRSGRGRQTYESKREQVLSSATHFVEIDLLRAYEPMAMFGAEGPSDYRILVSRSEQRPIASLYAFSVQNSIPAFALPLRSGDLEPTVDLQGLLNEIYERSGYDLKLDYGVEPVPPLTDAEAVWASGLLK